MLSPDSFRILTYALTSFFIGMFVSSPTSSNSQAAVLIAAGFFIGILIRTELIAAKSISEFVRDIPKAIWIFINKDILNKYHGVVIKKVEIKELKPENGNLIIHNVFDIKSNKEAISAAQQISQGNMFAIDLFCEDCFVDQEINFSFDGRVDIKNLLNGIISPSDLPGLRSYFNNLINEDSNLDRV